MTGDNCFTSENLYPQGSQPRSNSPRTFDQRASHTSLLLWIIPNTQNRPEKGQTKEMRIIAKTIISRCQVYRLFELMVCS